jgi:hypothetical protein
LIISISFAITITFKEEIQILIRKYIYVNETEQIKYSNSEKKKKIEIKFIYDTYPPNNNYIIGDLDEEELKILDQIIEEEKRLCGLRLTIKDLNILSANNSKINDAYYRWRKCKDLMRSSGRVIYPSERIIYFNNSNN